MRAHVKASVQAALFSCLMAVNSTNAMSETPSHEGEELAPVNAEEVYIVG
jgi:hypothetical protein